MKKLAGDITILHMRTKNHNHMIDDHMICMVPEIWSETEKCLPFWAIFCPLNPLTTQKIKILKLKNNNNNNNNKKNTCRCYHFTHLHYKWQSYDVWFLRYRARQTELLSFWTVFCPFYPPKDLENQNFEKMRKTSEGIIILQMYTINDSHMMYGY